MTKNEISLGDLEDNSGGTREKLNVNSPKGGKTTMFATPASAITQVTQEDVERQLELAKRLARGAEESGESQQEVQLVSSGQPTRPKNCARCFSCWLCCGSGSSSTRDPTYRIQPTEICSERDDNNKIVTGSGDDWQAAETEVCTIEQPDEVDPNVEQCALEASESEEDWLLDSVSPSDQGRKCLVLDLDETLVHSSFQPIDCSFAISMELDGTQYGVSVLKRPFVDEFIAECSKWYELVVFTASLPEYANPVLDRLDTKGLIKHRLFRQNCVIHQEQAYVKDLSKLGRNLKDCIIIDNSPLAYLFHPTNAIGCTSWFGDETDTELQDLLPVLRGDLLTVNDVRTMLDANNQSCEWIIHNYGERTNEHGRTTVVPTLQ